MPAEGPYKRDRLHLLYGIERVKRYTMATATATVAATTLTDTAWSFAVDEFAGQIIVFVDGSGKDKQYDVTSNTATVITCDAADFVTDGVDDEDSFYVTQYGKKPATTANWLGIFPNIPGLEEERDVLENFAIGAGRNRLNSLEGLHKIEESLECILQTPAIVALALGSEASIGTLDVTSTTLTADVEAGHDQVDVTSATGLAVDDYIQISAGTDPTVEPSDATRPAEVRKITAIDALVLTLDAALNHRHLNTDAVKEVIAPFTHYWGIGPRSPSWSVERAFKAVETLVFHTQGIKATEITLSAERDGQAKANVPIVAKNTKKGLASVSSLTTVTTRAYYMKDGALLFNGATVARLKKFSHKIGLGTKAEHYIQDVTDDALEAYEAIEGNVHHETNFTTATINSRYFDDLQAGLEVDATITFTRTATDYLKFYMNDVRVKIAKHPGPEEGLVEVEVRGVGGSTSAEAQDSTPYYL